MDSVDLLAEFADEDVMPELWDTPQGKARVEKIQNRIIAALKRTYGLTHNDAVQMFVDALRARRARRRARQH